MSGRGRIILTAVLVFLACLLLYFFFVKPQRTELAQVRADIEAENVRTSQLQAELQRLEDLRDNQAQLEAKLAKFRELVPLRPELANFIFLVQGAANQAGLDFVSITPELPVPPPEGAALAQVQSQISAAGGYFALQDFVRRLYALDRAIRIDSFDIAVQSEAGVRLTLNMSARMFHDIPTAATATPVGATPTVSPTPTPTP